MNPCKQWTLGDNEASDRVTDCKNEPLWCRTSIVGDAGRVGGGGGEDNGNSLCLLLSLAVNLKLL